MQFHYFIKNVFFLVITTLLVIHIIPSTCEYSSADDLIAAMLPSNGKYNAESISPDDLAESIYQNLIKRKLPPQEQKVANKAKAELIRAEAEKEAIREAVRKGRARKFLQRIKHSKGVKKRITELRRLRMQKVHK